jgi:HEPN domain-containing protein
MKPITAEWVDKAEGDWFAAQQLYRARKHPNYDGACFHAQQCAEKYLKAKLVEETINFSKVHDLVYLLNLLLPVEPGWASLKPHLTPLNTYAVLYRYPGYDAVKAEAKDAIKDCREVRRVVRQSFGLPV